MRAKPARESGSSRVLGISRLASAVVRKKKQNRTELKKTVRFSLNARLSSSETVLSQDAKPDSQQLKPEQDIVETCGDLKSQSCLSIATRSTTISQCPSHSRRSVPGLRHSETPGQFQFKPIRMKGFDRYFRCFNELYLLGPIFNLHRMLPKKGILKMQQKPQTESSVIHMKIRNTRENPQANQGHLSTTSDAETRKKTWGTARFCPDSASVGTFHMRAQGEPQSSSRTAYFSCGQPTSFYKSLICVGNPELRSQSGVFDNLASSMQRLHISAYSKGDQAYSGLHNSAGVTSWQSGFKFYQN